jgi:hypothetical protein
MRGRLIRVEALLGKPMEKEMPEMLDFQNSMSEVVPAENPQMDLPYSPFPKFLSESLPLGS